MSPSDLLGWLDVDEVGRGADATLADVDARRRPSTAPRPRRRAEAQRGQPLPTRLAVIAMGRLGGHELGYGSDADVLFVHDPLPGARRAGRGRGRHAVANELRRLLGRAGPDPPLLVDADLRPEGRQGPLVRTLASYAAYYERWSLGLGGAGAAAGRAGRRRRRARRPASSS